MKHLRQYIRNIIKEEYEELEKTKLDLQQRTADWTAREEPYQQSLDSEIEMYPEGGLWDLSIEDKTKSYKASKFDPVKEGERIQGAIKDLGEAGFNINMLEEYILKEEISTEQLIADIKAMAWCMATLESLEPGLKALLGIPSLVLGIIALIVNPASTLAAVLTVAGAALMFLGGWGPFRDQLDSAEYLEMKPDRVLKYLPFHPIIEEVIEDEYFYKAFINDRIFASFLQEKFAGEGTWNELKFQAAVYEHAKSRGEVSGKGANINPLNLEPAWGLLDWSKLKADLEIGWDSDVKKTIGYRLKAALDQWGGEYDDKAWAWIKKKIDALWN